MRDYAMILNPTHGSRYVENMYGRSRSTMHKNPMNAYATVSRLGATSNFHAQIPSRAMMLMTPTSVRAVVTAPPGLP